MSGERDPADRVCRAIRFACDRAAQAWSGAPRRRTGKERRIGSVRGPEPERRGFVDGERPQNEPGQGQDVLDGMVVSLKGKATSQDPVGLG